MDKITKFGIALLILVTIIAVFVYSSPKEKEKVAEVKQVTTVSDEGITTEVYDGMTKVASLDMKVDVPKDSISKAPEKDLVSYSIKSKQENDNRFMLPAYYYPYLEGLYQVPEMHQTVKEKDAVKEIVVEKKKISLSYYQKAGSKETNFTLEAENPSREERVELYKLFVQEAREAQEALRSYKVDIKSGDEINVFGGY
jgi:hypothetical protein